MSDAPAGACARFHMPVVCAYAGRTRGSSGDVGRGEPGPGADVGRGEPGPGADVGRGEPVPGADVGGGEPSPGAHVGRGEPNPGADVDGTMGREGGYRCHGRELAEK